MWSRNLLGNDDACNARRSGQEVVRHADVDFVLPLVEFIHIKVLDRFVSHDNTLERVSARRRSIVDDIAQTDHTGIGLHVLPSLENDTGWRDDEGVQRAVVATEIGVDGNTAESENALVTVVRSVQLNQDGHGLLLKDDLALIGELELASGQFAFHSKPVVALADIAGNGKGDRVGHHGQELLNTRSDLLFVGEDERLDHEIGPVLVHDGAADSYLLGWTYDSRCHDDVGAKRQKRTTA